MRAFRVLGGLALLGAAFVSGNALAACRGQASAGSGLSGKTLCYTKANGDRFQEYHAGGPNSGDVIDWKKGATDKVDPTKKVGTWSANGNNITYTYGSQSYTYAVFRNGNSNNFCLSGNGEEITPVVRNGQVACQ